MIYKAIEMNSQRIVKKAKTRDEVTKQLPEGIYKIVKDGDDNYIEFVVVTVQRTWK